jgi:hypothetical protein
MSVYFVLTDLFYFLHCNPQSSGFDLRSEHTENTNDIRLVTGNDPSITAVCHRASRSHYHRVLMLPPPHIKDLSLASRRFSILPPFILLRVFWGSVRNVRCTTCFYITCFRTSPSGNLFPFFLFTYPRHLPLLHP